MTHITLTELAIGVATILLLGVALIVVHKQETQVIVPQFVKPQACVDYYAPMQTTKFLDI